MSPHGIRGRSSGRPFLAGWTLRCAAAEAVGMTAAATAAKFASVLAPESASATDRLAALGVVIVAGLVEGTALGALQADGLARLLPELDRRRWLRVTVAVAGLGWALGSAGPVLAGDDAQAAGPPLLLSVGGGAALGLAMGALLGAAQARCLRGNLDHPYRWSAVNAAGWSPAMGILFLGASAPAADWSVLRVAALGTLTGLAAGAVLGLVTGALLPVLGEPPQRRAPSAPPSAAGGQLRRPVSSR